ncbi:MAG: hypothetical protein R3B45_05785 [Bdellovibrionota bacterium]
MLIRKARIEDAAEIANVHINSWREAYRGLLPESFLDFLRIDSALSAEYATLLVLPEYVSWLIGILSFVIGVERTSL